MKKRLLSIISLIACLCFVFTFAASPVKAAENNSEYTADVFQSYMQEWMNTWFSGDMNSINSYNEQYEQSGLSVKYDVDEDKYKETVKKAGTFKKFGDAELTQDGDVITVNQSAECEEKNVDFVFTYNIKEGSVLWTAEVEADMTELLEKALLNTLMGMGTVFIVLIFISFVISLFKVFSRADKKKADKMPDAVAEAAPVAAIEDEDLSDDELAAVISAAIAAYEAESGNDYEVPADGLYVRSIKKRGFAI